VLGRTIVVVWFCWEIFLYNIAYIRGLKHILCNHNPISEVLSHNQYNYPVEKKNRLAAQSEGMPFINSPDDRLVCNTWMGSL